MIEEEAYVTEVANGRVWIEKSQRSACSACTETCATALVGGLLGGKHTRMPIDSNLPLFPGDRVVIGIATDAVPQASFFIYLLPLFALFGGAMFGQYAAGADWASALGGLAGLALCYAGMKVTRLFDRDAFQPVILRKID